MTWPGLTQDVEHLCSICQVCQLTKNERKKYGLLPPKKAESDPWVMVCVDLVRRFIIKTPSKIHSLLALSMIDPATEWFEIVKATNKSSSSIQDLFHNTWLARYPRLSAMYKCQDYWFSMNANIISAGWMPRLLALCKRQCTEEDSAKCWSIIGCCI